MPGLYIMLFGAAMLLATISLGISDIDRNLDQISKSLSEISQKMHAEPSGKVGCQ